MLNIYATTMESLFKKKTPNTQVTPSKQVTMPAPFAQYLERDREIFVGVLRKSSTRSVILARLDSLQGVCVHMHAHRYG